MLKDFTEGILDFFLSLHKSEKNCQCQQSEDFFLDIFYPLVWKKTSMLCKQIGQNAWRNNGFAIDMEEISEFSFFMWP